MYDGIDFLRSGDPKTRLFVALKSKSKRGLANLLKHGAGFSRSSLAGVHRKLRDARGSKGRAVPAPIENDRFRSGFSDACQTQTRGGAREAGVRKASREETAGEFAPTLVSVYGEFAGAA